MSAILSILVPTLECRDAYFARLHKCLAPQLGDEVELLRLRDDGQETIGAKRHRLLHAAQTTYVAFVDDDDLVADDYCRRVLSALGTSPDVVGFRLVQYDDGMLSANTIHSVTAKSWHTVEKPDCLPTHYRTPNHLNPVRREMALAVGYLNVNHGEDADYSRRLFERFPDMREEFIDADLYFYHRRFNRNERCNPNP